MLDDALLFTKVVESGSFSKAARLLSVSTAQLSRNVSRLERQLGIKLLIRTTRKLELTEAGDEYFKSCQTISEIHNKALDRLYSYKNERRGDIRISAPIGLGSLLIQPVIERFIKKNPLVRISLDLTDKLVAMPSSSHDIVFRLTNRLEDSTLFAKKISTVEYCLCASASYLNEKSVNTLEDLLNCDYLASNLSFKEKVEFIDSQDLYLQSVISVNDYRSQIELALRGLGCIKVPRLMVDTLLESKQLVEILGATALKPKTLWAVYAENQSMSLRLKAFLQAL